MVFKLRGNWVLALLLASGTGFRAEASGFQLKEQSPSAQGNSFAGVSAGGTDIGGMFFNPATMTLFEGQQYILGFSGIGPSARLEDGQGARAAFVPAPLKPIAGGAGGDAGRGAILPVFYAMWSVSPDLRVGLSLNSPFGLSSGYDDAWIGRYHALRSAMKVVEVAPNLAWRFHPRWSLGLALTARYVDAELTNAVDFGSIGAALKIPGSVPGAQDGHVKVSGTQWRYGYKLGLLWQATDRTRLGVGYHSAMDFGLKGEVSYQGVPAALATAFRNGHATPMAHQPATASLGLSHELGSGWTLQAEAARTFWSPFKEIRIRFDTGQGDSVTDEHWKDTWFFALGATWKPGGAWTFRTGVAVDQTPTTDTYRTPRIPDAERTWLSVGAGYAFSSSVSMDLGYSHILVKDGVLDLKATQGTPDFFRGDLKGRYRSSIDILAVQLRMSF